MNAPSYRLIVPVPISIQQVTISLSPSPNHTQAARPREQAINAAGSGGSGARNDEVGLRFGVSARLLDHRRCLLSVRLSLLRSFVLSLSRSLCSILVQSLSPVLACTRAVRVVVVQDRVERERVCVWSRGHVAVARGDCNRWNSPSSASLQLWFQLIGSFHSLARSLALEPQSLSQQHHGFHCWHGPRGGRVR